MEYRITNASIMVILDGESHTIQKSQPNYQPVLEGILANDVKQVRANLTIAQTMTNWSSGAFSLDAQRQAIIYKGEAVHPTISALILDALRRGVDASRYMAFWEKLEENPSNHSFTQFMEFLARYPLPITPDGDILAYKGVTSSLRDCHSGKFDNSPGQWLFMRRNRVSDDPDVPCHFGYHVGAHSYASSFGEKVIICRVNPRDVVCVPKDHSYQKIRVNEYKVVGMGSRQTSLPTAPMDIDDFLDTYEKHVYQGSGAEHYGAKHTDGSQLTPGESQPLEDESTKVVLPLIGTEWDYLHGLDVVAMGEVSLDVLRKYARHNCLIVGASKIPGGKSHLISLIVEARGYHNPRGPSTPDHIVDFLPGVFE